MKNLVVVVVVLLCGLVSKASQAAIEYDQLATNSVIYGTGNSNGGFTVDRVGTVELGLRAHTRYPSPSDNALGIKSQGNGDYGIFATGNFGPGGDRGSWNYDWSINTDYLDPTSMGAKIADFTYRIDIDYDPTSGMNFLSFDPIGASSLSFDHAFGDNSTPDNGGTEATDAASYAALVAGSNLVQNSWNLGFFTASHPQPFDPTANGIYTIRLSAFDALGATVAQASIDVLVGVPEPIAFLTWAGLIGCAAVAVRRPQR